MTQTNYIFTGLQPFWNFDSFSIAPRRFGGGIGYINTTGGKITYDDQTHQYTIPTDFNFMFQATDLALKFHNNSPFLNRFWNSTESLQATYINNHYGLFGKWWTCNYEHCLIEDTANHKVTEIGQTGERNVYTESGGTYTAPSGVLKDMTKASSEFDIKTRDYTTYHFKQYAYDESNLYRLEYVKDKNNVRVYVEWEKVSIKYRIKQILTSTDSGDTKIPVLVFKYRTITISQTDYHFVSQIVDNASRTWSYTQSTDKGLLTKVQYPTGIEHNYEYDSSTDKFVSIYDPNKNKWEIDYTNKLWKISVGVIIHYTYYAWSIDQGIGVVTCTRRDPRSSSSADNNYRQLFIHNLPPNITGNLMSHQTTDTSDSTWIVTQYGWINNQLTSVREPNAVAAGQNDYTGYSYNSDKMLEYIKKYDDGTEQTRYRVKYSYNSGDDKYELAAVEKDFSGGTYYFTKTEYTYDTNHNLIKTVAGINPDPNATLDPDSVSIKAITIYEYDVYGSVVKTIDPQGGVTVFEYDTLGAMIKSTNAMGGTNEHTYDSLSLNALSRTDANGNVSRFTYDALGQLVSTADAIGGVSTTTYDANGNVLSRSSAAGEESMSYDGKNRMTESTDRSGLTTCHIYAKNDQKTQDSYYLIDLTGGTATTMPYLTQYAYNNSGRLHTVTDAESQVTTYTYDKTGNVLTVADPNSNVTVTNTYNFANQLLTATYQRVNSYLGSVIYEYSGPMAMTSKVTRRSNDNSGGGGGVDTDEETTYTYDRLGRLYKEVKPQVTYGATTWTFSTLNYYDNNGNVVKVVNRKYDGTTTTDRYVINEYDNLGRLIVTRSQIAEASGVNAEQTVGYGYDAIGNRASASVNGVVLTRTTYDPAGRAVETVHASGHKQVRVYAQSGELTALWFDGADTGDLNPVSIDNRGQILNISSSGVRRKTSYAYDGAGRQTAVTDEAGRTTSREYLQNGWLKRIVRPNGDFIQYTYDKVARLTKVEEVAAGYDGTGYALRATLEVKYGYGTYTATIGTGFTQEANYNRWVEYITKKTEQPLYYGTVYFFDKNDRLAEVRFLDANDAQERKYKYTYDGFGNLAKVDKPDAATIDYTYNKLNQMTREYFDANNYNDYEYCCCSLVKHQQTVAGSQLNPYELTMDKLHRLTKEQYPDAGNPKTQYFEYMYDNAGRRNEMTDPTYGRAANEPKPQRWSYDEDGMLLKVGHTQDDNYLRNRGEDYGVMYDNRGRISKVLYPGENNQPVMEVEYKYNDADQVTAIIARDVSKGAATDIYCMQYDYDINGRKIRQVIKTDENDPDTSAYYVTTFNYDTRDMLTEEKYLRWDNANSIWMVMYWGRYKYDTVGNMVKRDVEQIIGGDRKSYGDTMTYSRGYQVRTLARTDNVRAQACTYAMVYDNNGNMTSLARVGGSAFTDPFYEITQMEFQYDRKNRMTNYRFGGSGSYCAINYDALGRVRSRVDLTPMTTKYYSDGRQLVQQLDNSNVVQFDYLSGPTGLDRQWNEASDKRYFYIKDPLGTVWAMIESGFTPEQSPIIRLYNYNAWGEHLDASDINFPDYDDDPNLMRYIGCRVEAFGKGTTTQRDAIYHLDTRHYLPMSHSFIQRDPLSLANSSPTLLMNQYIYGLNNPVNTSDPSGLFIPIIIVIGAAALLLACAGCGGSGSRIRKEPPVCDCDDCIKDMVAASQQSNCSIYDFCCTNKICYGPALVHKACMWPGGGGQYTCKDYICGREGEERKCFCDEAAHYSEWGDPGAVPRLVWAVHSQCPHLECGGSENLPDNLTLEDCVRMYLERSGYHNGGSYLDKIMGCIESSTNQSIKDCAKQCAVTGSEKIIDYIACMIDCAPEAMRDLMQSCLIKTGFNIEVIIAAINYCRNLLNKPQGH